jgi:hypothetical protein
LLNSYSFAAYNPSVVQKKYELPYLNEFEKDFKQAGVFIKSTTNYYAIINYKKGGTIKVYNKQTEELDIEDGGFFGKLSNNTKVSTQFFQPNLMFEKKEVKSSVFQLNESYPSAKHTVIIRLLSLSIFYNKFMRELFKKIVVYFLITKKQKASGYITRMFIFDNEKIIIKEKVEIPNLGSKLSFPNCSRAIHMASSGYGEKQYSAVSQLVKYYEI